MGDISTLGIETTLPLSDAEVQRFLRECLPLIRERFAPTVLILFGSRITGGADKWSDIDLIVASPAFSGLPFVERMHLFRREIRPHRSVDALCYTPEEFQRASERPTVVREALKVGVRLI